MDLKKEILSLKIECLRKELVKVANSKGMENPETIRLSHQLDKLIHKYQKFIN